MPYVSQNSYPHQTNFRKNVGIIFLEKPSNYVRRFKESKRVFRGRWKSQVDSLDFDQVASAHLFLQMNYIQNIFEFQVIRPNFMDEISFPHSFPHENKNIMQWFHDEITNKLVGRVSNVDYWMGLTSLNVGENWFFKVGRVQEGKMLSIITSQYWERDFSPPSLFEYIALSIFICSLQSLNFDSTREWLDHERTKGCIFDFPRFKYDRRILVSNPGLCQTCRAKLKQLEETMGDQTGDQIEMIKDVERIISKEWMGNLEKRDSPFYNLNRNYKYNMDRNSGFYKTWVESTLDSLKNNSSIWIATGVTSMFFLLLGTFLTTILKLKPSP